MYTICFIGFQLQDAVTTAHETSDAFSDETLREQKTFQHAKDAEMKEMLSNLADGEIEFYQSVRLPLSFSPRALTRCCPGNGRVGTNYTYNSADKSGCLAPVCHSAADRLMHVELIFLLRVLVVPRILSFADISVNHAALSLPFAFASDAPFPYCSSILSSFSLDSWTAKES